MVRLKPGTIITFRFGAPRSKKYHSFEFLYIYISIYIFIYIYIYLCVCKHDSGRKNGPIIMKFGTDVQSSNYSDEFENQPDRTIGRGVKGDFTPKKWVFWTFYIEKLKLSNCTFHH